jgi:hypothetical protein
MTDEKLNALFTAQIMRYGCMTLRNGKRAARIRPCSKWPGTPRYLVSAGKLTGWQTHEFTTLRGAWRHARRVVGHDDE